jgi:hypothetical protein
MTEYLIPETVSLTFVLGTIDVVLRKPRAFCQRQIWSKTQFLSEELVCGQKITPKFG